MYVYTVCSFRVISERVLGKQQERVAFSWISHGSSLAVHLPLKENGKKTLSNVKRSEKQPVSRFPKQFLLTGGPPSFDRILQRRDKREELGYVPRRENQTL